MNASQRANWERTRAKGFWRFVLLWGLLVGGSTFIGTAIYEYFTSPYGIRVEDMKIKVPIFLIAGFVGGAVLWFYTEYKYKKSSSNAS